MAKGQRKVVVKITSDTKGLVNGLTKAELTLGNFAKTGRAAANVAGKALATGASAAAAGIAAIYAATAPAIVQMRELAQVSDTSVKVFQRQAYAAKSVGIEHEKYGDILKDVKDRVGDFLQTGGGPMADFFENIAPKVGVTAEQFKNLSGPQALQLFVSSLEKANLSQAEMTFYMEAMASDSTKLLPLLRGNGKEMKRLGDEAERTGYVLSAIDAAKVKEADEATKRAKAAMEGLTRRITVQLAPAVEFLAEMFTKNAEETGGFKDEVGTAFEYVVEGAALAANALRGIEVIWAGLKVAANASVLVITEGLEWVLRTVDQVVGGINEATNYAIRGVNMVAGTKIPELDTAPLAGVIDTVDGITESLKEQTKATAGELHNLMMEALPGDELREKLRVAYEAAEEAARQTAQTSEGGQDAAGVGGMTPQQEAEMEAFRESLLTKEEAEMEHYQRRLEQFALYGEQLYATEEERAAALERLNKEHQDNLTKILQEGGTAREKFDAMTWDQQVSHTAGALVQMTEGLAQHSRKMFEINKAAAIAQAGVDAIKGAMSTWNAYPYPWNIPMTALHIAGSVARLNAIKSASFGAGGAPSQAPTPSTPVHETGGSAGGDGGGGGQPKGMATINLNGDMFSRGQVQRLGEQMNELARDGFEFQFAKG